MSHRDPSVCVCGAGRLHDQSRAAMLLSSRRVPCLLRNGSGTCTIEKSFDPASGKPDKRIVEAVHAVRVTPSEAQDGRVYNADRTPIGNPIGGDGQTWSATSIRLGSPQSPTDDLSARDVVHRYAKHIVGAVAAADSQESPATEAEGPFKIPNTFEGRAGLRAVQDRIRDQSIAIVGLGGTGAYVLDLLAKTPVPEIHLLDADELEWHNFMRAPGAPSDEEVESRKAGPLSKVDYYRSKYASFREGVFVHPVRVDSVERLTEFLARHPVDFAFVCIDQRKDGESPRQDVVYEALSLGNVRSSIPASASRLTGIGYAALSRRASMLLAVCRGGLECRMPEFMGMCPVIAMSSCPKSTRLRRHLQ